MRRPTNFDHSVARAWLDHSEAFWAWEELHRMVQYDRPQTWRMIQIMVAYAPDRGTLGVVAAGPVEDMCGWPSMKKEAETNERLRICLGMAYGLPPELEQLADHRTSLETLPKATPIEATPEEIRLMVAYFHLSETSWATRLLNEQTRDNPNEALFMLQLLLNASKERPSLRQDVFMHAFDLFVHLNFDQYREELQALARDNDDLRQWLLKRSRVPANPESWDSFISDLRLM